MPSDADLERLRARLRDLWRQAPGGTWTAPGDQALRGGVRAELPDGSKTWIASCFYGEAVAQLVAESRNAVPVLFAELDRQRRGVPVLGEVDAETGRVTWQANRPRSTAPSPSPRECR